MMDVKGVMMTLLFVTMNTHASSDQPYNTSTESQAGNTTTTSSARITDTTSSAGNTNTTSSAGSMDTNSSAGNTAITSPAANMDTTSSAGNTAITSSAGNTATNSAAGNTATTSPASNTATTSPAGNTVKDSPGPEAVSISVLPIAIILSFVGGVLTVLIPLWVCKLRRKRQWCFAEKQEPPQDKWHDASVRITNKVIRMHTLERLNEMDIDRSVSISMSQQDDTAYKPEMTSNGTIQNSDSGFSESVDESKTATNGSKQINKSQIANQESDSFKQTNFDASIVKDDAVPREISGLVDARDTGMCSRLDSSVCSGGSSFTSSVKSRSERSDTDSVLTNGSKIRDSIVDRTTGMKPNEKKFEVDDIQVFEYERDSAMSEINLNDYFLVENENFRNSQLKVHC